MLITTIDNPFDPFVQWDEWKRFDEDMKHYTWNLLARIVKTSDDLSDADYDQAVDNAINEMVSFNINGLYRKVYRNDVDRGGI